jgi:hypothetical protein
MQAELPALLDLKEKPATLEATASARTDRRLRAPSA